jgi:hypothetical protein
VSAPILSKRDMDAPGLAALYDRLPEYRPR